MKNLYIVANWKSNKTQFEAREWLVKIANSKLQIANSDNKEVIVCPPFTVLSEIESGIKNYELGFKIGGQDISPFDEGAYTGEVSASLLKEFAGYVLVGHSERRNNFFESIEMINLKITQAFKYGLTPIVCVSNLEQVKTLRKTVGGNSQFITAYEPLFAIGSGIADTPENADRMAKSIKDVLGEIPVLYGGSITSKNVKEFTQIPNINGVLVGGASLDAKEFYAIIQNA